MYFRKLLKQNTSISYKLTSVVYRNCLIRHSPRRQLELIFTTIRKAYLFWRFHGVNFRSYHVGYSCSFKYSLYELHFLNTKSTHTTTLPWLIIFSLFSSIYGLRDLWDMGQVFITRFEDDGLSARSPVEPARNVGCFVRLARLYLVQFLEISPYSSLLETTGDWEVGTLYNLLCLQSLPYTIMWWIVDFALAIALGLNGCTCPFINKLPSLSKMFETS